MAQPYSGRDVVRTNSIEVENAQLRVENEALRWKMREMEVQNSDLQQRLGDGRRALVVLAAIVLGEPKGEEEVRRWMNPRPELEEVENEREHLVDQDVHGHVDPDMEEDSEELEESQTEQSSAPVSLLSPAEPVDSVEILTPEWRLPYEQRIAWQTAEDEIWKDAINQKSPVEAAGYNSHPEYYGVYLKGLPRRLELATLCRSIHAGRIHRIFLYNSGPYKYSEALVAFVDSAAAKTFNDMIQAKGFSIAGNRGRESDVYSDPHLHYLISRSTRDDISDGGMTRCLLMANLPPTLTAETVRRHIEDKIVWVPGKKITPQIESIISDEKNRTIQVNMAGIYLVENIKSSFKHRREYSRVKFTYAPDPCEPIERQKAVLVINRPPTPIQKPLPAPPPPPAPPSALSLYRTKLLSTANPNPTCRKLVFTGLPCKLRLSAFARKIRGGIVDSIYLYSDTKPGHPVAIVIFRESIPAWQCYVYLTATCTFGTTLLPFAEVRPDTRLTIVRPPPAAARRCVRVSVAPLSIVKDVLAILDTLHKCSYIGRPSQLLESITTDPDDASAVQIVFSQIQVARTVIIRLRVLRQYSPCVFSYGKDPCDMMITEERSVKKEVRFDLW